MDSTLSYLKLAILKKEAKFLKHCRSQGHWRSNRANRDKSMNLVQIFSSRGTAERGPRGQGSPWGLPICSYAPGQWCPLSSSLGQSGFGPFRTVGRGERGGGRSLAVSKVGSSVSARLAFRRLDIVYDCHL